MFLKFQTKDNCETSLQDLMHIHVYPSAISSVPGVLFLVFLSVALVMLISSAALK